MIQSVRADFYLARANFVIGERRLSSGCEEFLFEMFYMNL